MIRPAEGFLRALVLPSLFISAAGTATADTQVRNAFRLHVSQDELKNLAHAFGEEISKKTIDGTYGGTASDDLGFTQVSAQGITFTATVARVDSLIRESVTTAGSSALATKVVLGSLDISIETLSLNESGSILCNGLTVSSTAPLNLTMDLVPVIDGQVLFMNPANIALDDPGQFHAAQPGSCRTPWGFNWLVKQIAPWLAGKLRVQLASAVSAEIVHEIERQTALVSEESNVRFALPWKSDPAPSVSASARLWPDVVALQSKGLSRERSLTLDFGTDIAIDAAEAAEILTEDNKGQTGIATWDGWIGASEQLVAGVISEAVRADLLSVTLNKQTAPGHTKVLTARELGRFVPDAATRFNGQEDVEIRLGQAEAVSVIFKPNGPGGIPIIDAVLQEVPVEVKVAGASYFTTSSTMRFSYLTAADTAGGRLLFNFTESAHSVQRVTWSPDLYPKPADLTVTGTGFSRWLAGFADCAHAKKARTFGIALPDIHIGSYSVRWLDAVSIREGYLAVAAAVR